MIMEKVTISDATRRVIACHQSLNNLMEQLTEAAEYIYGTADFPVWRKCVEAGDRLQEAILELTKESIGKNITDVTITKI